MEVNFLNIATEAISRGFAVIPLKQGSKDPDFQLVPKVNGVTGTGGAARRTRDLAQIAEWAAVSPHANLGICSDEYISVLESDDESKFRQLVRDVSRSIFGQSRELPETLTSQAREGRPHFFYKATATTNAVEGAPGIQGLFEWRRYNQYVVGPGSLHPSGTLYQIVNNVPIIEMPDWLVDVLLEIKRAYQGETSRASKYVRVGPAAIARDALINNYALDPQAMLADEGFEMFIGAGERHYFLQAMAGLLHDGNRDSDELFEILTAMRDKYCESGKGDYEIKNLVEWTLQKEACTIEPNLPDLMKNGVIYRNKEDYDAAPDEKEQPMSAADLAYKYPAVKGDVQQYTLLPRVVWDGWFARGRPHVVAGKSGTGKSRLMLNLLMKQKHGEVVLGHRGAGLRELILWADRGRLSNKETLMSMGIDESDVNLGFLSAGVYGVLAIQEIKEKIESFPYNELPEVVFVEGGDMLVEDNNDKSAVALFLGAARALAEHYHIALIFSSGAAKTKGNNAPSAMRDRIIGSEQWGRSCDDTVTIEFEEDGTETRRKVTIQHRCAGAERFSMEFSNGLLVEVADDTAGDDALWEFVVQQPGEFKAVDMYKLVSQQLGMKRATYYARVKRYQNEGKLAQRIDGKAQYLKVVGVKL